MTGCTPIEQSDREFTNGLIITDWSVDDLFYLKLPSSGHAHLAQLKPWKEYHCILPLPRSDAGMYQIDRDKICPAAPGYMITMSASYTHYEVRDGKSAVLVVAATKLENLIN